ncbi:MAG: ferrochelatase [Pseudomonadota bacterium]
MKWVPVGTLAIFLGACGVKTESESKVSPSKIGILLASHGDIDNADTELKPYIEVSFKKNVGIPLPDWSREILTGPAYALSVSTVKAQYDIIGATNYKAKSEIQRQAVEEELARVGLKGRVYLGYNFTPPFIYDALTQMQKDGIEKIVVFNKGAQFSYASSGENMEDTLEYLHDHPEWNVEAIGYKYYSQDERFRAVLAEAIQKDAQSSFPGVLPKDICILVASHGLPMWLIDKGDPAIRQMRDAFADIKVRLREYRLYHGFLNDDFFPGAQWVSPKALVVADKLAEDGCKNVLMDGRLSFTTHHRATLYDLNYEVRNRLAQLGGAPNQGGPKVVLAPNFDGSRSFANLIATLSKEALSGKGKLAILKKKDIAPLAENVVGMPGTPVD